MSRNDAIIWLSRLPELPSYPGPRLFDRKLSVVVYISNNVGVLLIFSLYAYPTCRQQEWPIHGTKRDFEIISQELEKTKKKNRVINKYLKVFKINRFYGYARIIERGKPCA